jgi:transposase
MLDIKLTLEVHFFMSKYTYEFKLKIVKEHLNEHFGFAYLSKKYNIQSKENIREWVRKYEIHGDNGLKKNPFSYDGNFKRDVVKYMCDSNSSATQVSYKYNIGVSLVMKWYRIYTEKGPQYLDIENRGRPNMRKIKKETNKKPLTREEELEKRIKMLEMENDYLKKLQALIQEEERKLQKKSK